MIHLCPFCHKAEPIKKCEHSVAGQGTIQAAAVTLAVNCCGRCIESIAKAALSAAEMHCSALRRKGGK